MLNEVVELSRQEMIYEVSFESNGEQFGGLYYGEMLGYLPISGTDPLKWVYDAEYGWEDQAYRTITLDSPAIGEFLTWLEANAVKQ